MSEESYLAAQHQAESAPWPWLIAVMFVFVGVPLLIVQADKYWQQLQRQRRTCARHEVDRALRRTQTVPSGAADGVRSFEWTDDLDIDWTTR
jgi:hypothetical protein